jgi:phage terminase small subunit
MKARRKLTKKQADFVRCYIETGNGVRAALKAYDTDDYMTAHSIAVENLQKPTVRALIDEIMEEIGFDDKHLKRIHMKLLDDENRSIALKALDMAYKLKGRYAQAQLEATAKMENEPFTYEDFIERMEKSINSQDTDDSDN